MDISVEVQEFVLSLIESEKKCDKQYVLPDDLKPDPHLD
jgi:hypothetical protein